MTQAEFWEWVQAVTGQIGVLLVLQVALLAIMCIGILWVAVKK